MWIKGLRCGDRGLKNIKDKNKQILETDTFF